jgi:hypothetical protein
MYAKCAFSSGTWNGGMKNDHASALTAAMSAHSQATRGIPRRPRPAGGDAEAAAESRTVVVTSRLPRHARHQHDRAAGGQRAQHDGGPEHPAPDAVRVPDA